VIQSVAAGIVQSALGPLALAEDADLDLVLVGFAVDPFVEPLERSPEPSPEPSPDATAVPVPTSSDDDPSRPEPSPPDASPPERWPSVPWPSDPSSLVPEPAPERTPARRSFLAQPDPLKWTAGAWIALRTGPEPHTGQDAGGSAWTPWMTSNRRPQAAQS